MVHRTKCVLCGSPEIRAGRKVQQRRLTDLRFSASGVKRWVILYRARRYSCAACGQHFLPKEWPKYRGYFGDKLAAWCVYQNFTCRQTMWQAREVVEELLSIRFPVRQAYLFKQRRPHLQRRLVEPLTGSFDPRPGERLCRASKSSRSGWTCWATRAGSNPASC
jgi:hypothetical protein